MTTAQQAGFALAFTVDRPPPEVFAAVLDVGSWWTGEIEGSSGAVGDEFDYRHGAQHFSRQRVTVLEPDRRVVWHVVDSALAFAADPTEWTGTDIVFDLVAVDGGTEVRFTHVGLLATCDCYQACSAGWSHYVGRSLRTRITW
jgi:hypothetical protein